MSKLSDRAMLVVLSMPAWSASKQDKKAAQEIAERHHVDPSIVRAHKDLIDKDALDAAAKLRREARQWHYDHTSPYADKSLRILPNKIHLEYAAKMAEFGAAIGRLDDAFCATVYPALVDSAPARLNGLYNPLDFPPKEAIRDKFGFDYWFYKLPEADDFAGASDLSPEELKRIAASTAAHVQDGINGAVLHLAQRMRDCVARVAANMASYDAKRESGDRAILKDSVISNICDLVALVPALNITGNKAIDDLAAEMELTLCRFDPNVLKSSKEARAKAAKQATAILDKINAGFAQVAGTQTEGED